MLFVKHCIATVTNLLHAIRVSAIKIVTDIIAAHPALVHKLFEDQPMTAGCALLHSNPIIPRLFQTYGWDAEMCASVMSPPIIVDPSTYMGTSYEWFDEMCDLPRSLAMPYYRRLAQDSDDAKLIAIIGKKPVDIEIIFGAVLETKDVWLTNRIYRHLSTILSPKQISTMCQARSWLILKSKKLFDWVVGTKIIPVKDLTFGSPWVLHNYDIEGYHYLIKNGVSPLRSLTRDDIVGYCDTESSLEYLRANGDELGFAPLEVNGIIVAVHNRAQSSGIDCHYGDGIRLLGDKRPIYGCTYINEGGTANSFARSDHSTQNVTLNISPGLYTESLFVDYHLNTEE